MKATILDLLMKYQFANLSPDEETKLNYLLEQDSENQQMYLELRDDRNKLIDYIIKEVKSTEGQDEFDKERAKVRFFDAIR